MTRFARIACGAIGGALAMTIGTAAATPPTATAPGSIPGYGAQSQYYHGDDFGYGDDGYFYYYGPTDEGARKDPEELVFY